MKKIFLRLSVVTLAAILSFGVLTVSAKTGVDDGTVSFPSERGDVNDDGSIDIRDLVRLKKYIAGIQGVEVKTEKADLNGDGNCDAADLSELRIMLLKA